MKAAIALCIFGLVALSLARPEEEKYTDRWDSINIPELLENKILLEKYTDCIMDRGKCTADAKELKSKISDALQTKCAKCTDAQKKGSEQVIHHLIHHLPKVWAELKAKYDPTEEYSKVYEEELKKVSK